MTPLQNLSPPAKLVFLILLVMVGFFLVMIAGILLAGPLFHINILNDIGLMNDITNPAITGFLKFLQILQSTGLFILPPLAAGYFFGRNPVRYLKLDKSPGPAIYLLSFLIMFTALPVINWMVYVNELMNLPEFMSGIEKWMKASEDQAAVLTELFLAGTSIQTFLINMLMIAVIPAIGEEFLFRGILQRLFKEWSGNIHIAIFLSAFLFGVIHMQFYGLFPRMMIGVLFGYLFYWTGSLWIPVFAHFVNNGSAVVASFLLNRGVISTEYENIGSTDNIFLLIVSGLFTAFILWYIYLRSVKDQKIITG